MKKYIDWPELPDAVAIFYGIAAELAEISQYYYIIFSMGTIIKIPVDEIKPERYFTGYTPEHMETWPTWRINITEEKPLTATEIYNDLVQVWNQQSSQCDCCGDCNNNSDKNNNNESTVCIRAIVKCAYKILHNNQLHDVVPVVCEVADNTYMVEFCNGLNIVFTNDAKNSKCETGNDNDSEIKKSENVTEPVDISISLREYDLMFPQIYAIITPKLELIVFADCDI
jgi:hypothetical protein